MDKDKNQVEVMDRLKQMMLAFKVELNNRCSLSTATPKFILTNKTDYDIIELQMSATSNSKTITDEECFTLIENYLFGDEENKKSIKIFLIGQRNFNHVTQAIIKNPSDVDLHNKLIGLFFNTKNEDIYENFIIKINKAIKEKGFDSSLGKNLVFKVLNQIGATGSLPTYELQYFSKRFPDIMQKVAKFDINDTDYPTLHNVFSYYQYAIRESYMANNALEGFLKNKIPSKNWEQFKKYFKKENAYYEQPPKMSGMFEEKTNPKLHLNLNAKLIRDSYTILSISSDYSNMMQNIIKSINSLKDSFGLESCQTITTEINMTTLYCISKDENPIDAEKIKSVIASTIEMYAEAKEQKKEFSEKELLTVFRASILSYELENSSTNQEVTLRRTNKI